MTDEVTATDTLAVPEIRYSGEQVQLIKDMYARGATDDELKLLMYMSKKYGLDILTKQIWCVKYANQPAQIYTSRDGFISIAHRIKLPDGRPSLDGFKTTVERIPEGFSIKYYDKDKSSWQTFTCDFQYVATCTVYRKDMDHPIEITVFEEEYSTGRNLWQTKRRTMISKVAESQAFRKAFDISGLYGEEEMGQWEEQAKTGNMRYKAKPEPPKTIPKKPAAVPKTAAKAPPKTKPGYRFSGQKLDPRTFIIGGRSQNAGKTYLETPSNYIQWCIDNIDSGVFDVSKYGYDPSKFCVMLNDALAIKHDLKEKEKAQKEQTEQQDFEDVDYEEQS
jgi:phage recombination protein Bet